MRPRDDAGFTLLEVLAALVVLGLLMAGLASGTRLGLLGWRVQDRALAARDGLEPVDRALRRLVEAADPGSPDGRGSFKGEAGRLGLVVPADLLGRQTELTDRLDIAIGLEPEPGHDAERSWRLVLRSAPHVHARALHPAADETQQTVLLTGVHAIAFSYLDPADHLWHDTWDSNTLPALVRLRITRAGTAAQWPDLVWAPMRERSD